MSKFNLMMLALASMVAGSACSSSETPDPLGNPCADVNCDANEQCVVVDGAAVCEAECDPSTVSCADCDAENRTCQSSNDCAARTCGACAEGFVEEAGACVPEETFDCGTCEAQNRACDAASERCGGCVSGFFEDAGLCVAAPTCEVGAANSIAAECEANNRVCVDASATSLAQCGDCAAGFAPVAGQDACEASDVCLEDGTCADATKFCLQLADNNPPMCASRPCADGEAWDRGAGSCRSCPACPVGAGTTGAVWPVTDRGGSCVCETNDGFFWDPAVSGSRALECDLDGDGWTNGKVDQLLSNASVEAGASTDDWSLLLNLRCDVNEITGFVLENELGQRLDVTLAELGSSRPTLRLYESNRNDRGADAAPMPQLGRAFEPSEVNSLTKVCGVNLDLNDNGLADFEESQDFSGGEQFQRLFNRMGYFVELHTGAIEDDKFVISERVRCDTGELAIRGPVTSTEYWQSCHRRRPTDYQSSQPLGNDFAQFECAAQAGSCPLPPLWAPTLIGETVPPHSVCDLRTESIPGWRGMTHYSQFACVTVKNDTGVRAPQEIDRADVSLDSAQGWHVNNCQLSAQLGELDCTQVTTSSAADAAVDRVVWAARGYTDYEDLLDYEGGCVNEFAEWPETCPGQVKAPQFVMGRGSEEDFGRLICSFNEPPVANAGIRFSGSMSTLITLDGSASSDPDGDPIDYTWTQIMGPDVTLGQGTLTGTHAEFLAPEGVETLAFSLVVTDGEEFSAPDTVIVDILEDASAAYYVDRDNGSDQAGNGTRAQPFASIGGALAMISSANEDIYVMTSSTGTYDETSARLQIPSGTSVYGGFDADWVRDYVNNKTVVLTDNDGFRFDDVSEDAWLSGFDLQTTDSANASTHVHGVRAVGNGSALFGLEHNVISTGDVGPGTANAASAYGALLVQLATARVRSNVITVGAGGQGRDGSDGSNGSGGDNGSNSSSVGGSGGDGGNGGGGGAGGTRSNENGDSGSSGQSRDNPLGGTASGGSGGNGGPHNGSRAGGPGGNGQGGGRGVPGVAGTGLGNPAITGYSPNNGNRGGRGGHGAGGGGGGGGEADFLARNGSRGGSGGEGGQGGQGGQGGASGGASIGLWLAAVGNADVADNVVQSGAGGSGGSGGDGGNGGNGGNGGSGNSTNGSAGRGGSGGRGGNGGSGGRGGAGGGGPSFGVVFAAGVAPTLTNNVIASGIGGNGGVGGTRGNGGEGGYAVAVFDADPSDAFHATMSGNQLTAGLGGSGGSSGSQDGAIPGAPGLSDSVNFN